MREFLRQETGSFLRRALAVIATAVILVGVSITPASANYNNCPTGERVCTYNDTYGDGNNYNYSFTYTGNCVEIGYPWNDAIRSMHNQSSHQIMFYRDAGCSNNSFGRWLYEAHSYEPAIAGVWSSFKWAS